MKAKEIKGATILKVNQTRFFDSYTQKFCWALDSIELSNGKTLGFIAFETEHHPYVSPIIMRNKKGKNL